ncbi:recombinase [Shewanella sp. 202IG2-18]|uniref:recombinase n=1 Tax=Parashewanella hymeniacidonis TaxID=2807618 RepID=UPI0019601597|nr:recombinase [Parashewanella hymeniacidonis]MBM7070581.1 recombinase [Parashewanella hymeniacidonis]
MADVRKSKHTKSLPEHLYFDARRGNYRIKLVDGRYKDLGKDREEAISITKEYNRIARPKIAASVEKLLRIDEQGTDTCFGFHIHSLLKRILEEERPSEEYKKTLEKDAQRAKQFFINVPACEIGLHHVNNYLAEFHSDVSANVQNRKVAWLKKLFSYAIDESLMMVNPATLKKRKRKEEKKRQRLKLDWYQKIHAVAPLWLQTAMDLSLQTTHARLEISRIRYQIKKPTSKTCGCFWFKTPEISAQGKTYGTLYIHRQKVAHKEASHVAIPIGETLKQIIDRSRDNLVSNFAVHRLPERCNDKLGKDVTHLTQVAPNYISRAFSKLRDEVGCCDHLEFSQRPTFHEIRALAAHLFDTQGIDPQSRMAHTDAKSTKIYTENHIDWVKVPYAEIKFK